jgi:hypothetical protein
MFRHYIAQFCIAAMLVLLVRGGSFTGSEDEDNIGSAEGWERMPVVTTGHYIIVITTVLCWGGTDFSPFYFTLSMIRPGLCLQIGYRFLLSF